MPLSFFLFLMPLIWKYDIQNLFTSCFLSCRRLHLSQARIFLFPLIYDWRESKIVYTFGIFQ